MPLIIVDRVKDDYSIRHGGFLKKYYRRELIYVEGQILEVYEGWMGKEKVRVLNSDVTALITATRIYLPRDDMLRYGIIPNTWIVFSASRIGDPRKEEYYPIFPERIVVYPAYRDIISARLEELVLKSAGFATVLSRIIYRTFNVIEELKPKKKPKPPKKKKKKK